MFKCDMHVHSRHSKKPTNWILKQFGCPESFVEPMRIYEAAKARGMTHVTITDHNSIGGVLEIIKLPGVFMGCEFTCHFEDGCKIHVLAYGFSPAEWELLMELRKDVRAFVSHCRAEGIFHAVAHPLYSVNGKLEERHVREIVRLFDRYELNGMRSSSMNRITSALFGPGAIAIGGSDDHSGSLVAKRWTSHPGSSLEDLAASPSAIEVGGRSAEPYELAYSLYSIGYQYLSDRMDISWYVRNDQTARAIDRMLTLREREESALNSMVRKLRGRWRRDGHDRSDIKGVLFKSLSKMSVEAGSVDMENAGQRWFALASHATNASAKDLLDYTVEQLESGNLFNIFRSIGSISSMYFLLSPYYMAYNIFSEGQSFAESLAPGKGGPRVGHYTDTFYDVNGVARTLRQTLKCAREAGKNLEVIACSENAPSMGETVFKPVKTYGIPEYPELKLECPPLLEMIHHAYGKGFTHIHTATPGLVGLAGLLIAKVLKKPLISTYHTAFPQYVKAMTGENAMEDATWLYMTWYYRQCDVVLVPSKMFRDELAGHGVSPERMRLMPRGVDRARFKPGPQGISKTGEEFTLLYVGRVSKEKNLDVLAEAFKLLNRSNLKLRIVGGGPYLRDMQESLKGYHAEFAGYLEGEELVAEYQRADLFVFPSTTDTFGNVIVEAHACGLPTLVTEVGGPAENVSDGVNGAVVKGNDVHALKDGILKLLDKRKLSEMGQAAYEGVKDASFENAFEECWRLYE